jgi:hypothetical protein
MKKVTPVAITFEEKDSSSINCVSWVSLVTLVVFKIKCYSVYILGGTPIYRRVGMLVENFENDP